RQQFTAVRGCTGGKDEVGDEGRMGTVGTSSPVDYYSLAAWFMILTIWLLTFYSFFTNDEQVRMQNRMRLYGVTILQQLTAKITITFILTSIFAGIVLYTYTSFMAIPLYGEDYGRIVLIT